jgi:two-component sensor histidine kinase
MFGGEPNAFSYFALLLFLPVAIVTFFTARPVVATTWLLLGAILFLPERVQLSVKDDGQGFDSQAPRPGHYGLINLQERANKLGATVNVEAKPGAGVHVTFSVPLTG